MKRCSPTTLRPPAIAGHVVLNSGSPAVFNVWLAFSILSLKRYKISGLICKVHPGSTGQRHAKFYLSIDLGG